MSVVPVGPRTCGSISTIHFSLQSAFTNIRERKREREREVPNPVGEGKGGRGGINNPTKKKKKKLFENFTEIEENH